MEFVRGSTLDAMILADSRRNTAGIVKVLTSAPLLSMPPTHSELSTLSTAMLSEINLHGWAFLWTGKASLPSRK